MKDRVVLTINEQMVLCEAQERTEDVRKQGESYYPTGSSWCAYGENRPVPLKGKIAAPKELVSLHFVCF